MRMIVSHFLSNSGGKHEKFEGKKQQEELVVFVTPTFCAARRRNTRITGQNVAPNTLCV